MHKRLVRKKNKKWRKNVFLNNKQKLTDEVGEGSDHSDRGGDVVEQSQVLGLSHSREHEDNRGNRENYSIESKYGYQSQRLAHCEDGPVVPDAVTCKVRIPEAVTRSTPGSEGISVFFFFFDSSVRRSKRGKMIERVYSLGMVELPLLT